MTNSKPTNPNNRKYHRIPGLDGLRGIAATIVILAHMSTWGYIILPQLNFDGIGRSGVLLFFVLSAFLLTSQILNWDSKEIYSAKKWASYMVARVFRIIPLFFIVITTAFIFTNIKYIPIIWKLSDYLRELPVPMSEDSLFKHFALLEGEDILWTVPVEFKFYLILPIILITFSLFFSLNNSSTKLSLILLAYIAFDLVYLNNTQHYTDTLPFLSVFATGVLLAFLFRNNYFFDLSNSQRLLFEIVAWLCIAIYIVLIPGVFYAIFRVYPSTNITESNAIYSLLWGVFIFSMLHGRGVVLSILNSKFLVFLGAISFSLYLWHRIPIKLMHRIEYINNINISPTVKFIVVYSFSILIAYISYRIFEKPFLSAGSRIRKKIRAPRMQPLNYKLDKE